MQPSLDIIVLTKNNEAELIDTLSSLPRSRDSIRLHVLIIDGGNAYDVYSHFVASRVEDPTVKYSYFNLRDIGINGIYPSMNYALGLVSSDWFIFMNSGDTFARDFLFHDILDTLNNPDISIVFGQALIYSMESQVTWLVPDSRISNIKSWLRFFDPNHQSMFVRKHLSSCRYDLFSPYGADASWKRNLLRNNNYKYLPVCISCFKLGGKSSKVSLDDLRIKLFEPSRRFPERMLEIVKYVLNIFGLYTPFVQKIKSHLIGIFF